MYKNRYVITLILDEDFMFINKVKHTAGFNGGLHSHPHYPILSPYWMNHLTYKWKRKYKPILTTIFPNNHVYVYVLHLYLYLYREIEMMYVTTMMLFSTLTTNT